MLVFIVLVLVTSSTARPDPSSSGAGELNEITDVDPWPALGDPLIPNEFGGHKPLASEDEEDRREEYDYKRAEEEESTKGLVEGEADADDGHMDAEEKKEEEPIHSEEEDSEEKKDEEPIHSEEEEDSEEKKEEEPIHSEEEDSEEKKEDEARHSEEEEEKKPTGSVFDTPLFDVHRLTRYFKQLEDAVEKVFRHAEAGEAKNGTTYSDTTEEEVDSDGNKLIVHESVIKTEEDGGGNSSVIVEASLDGRTKRSNSESKLIQ